MKNKTREIQNAASNMKHSVLRFAKRISEGLTKPRQNFIADMLYGSGYDSNIVTEKLLDSKVKFIVRLCERTVICKGYAKEPMVLITNVFDDDNAICTTIVKCYLLRWKIEEFYRFKKETFNFEDVRVMSLQGMNNLNFLLNILIGFLSMKSTEGKDKPIIVSLINQVKRIYEPKNWLYSVCAGVKAVFAIINTGIIESPPDLNCGFEQLCFALDFL